MNRTILGLSFIINNNNMTTTNKKTKNTLIAVSFLASAVGVNFGANASELPKMRAASQFEKRIEFSIDGKKGSYELMGGADSTKMNLNSFRYSQQLENNKEVQYLFASSDDINSTPVRVEGFDGKKLTLSVQGTKDTLSFSDGEKLAEDWRVDIGSQEGKITFSFLREKDKELRSKVDTLRLPLGQLCFTYEPAPPHAKITIISYPEFEMEMVEGGKKTIGPVLYSKVEVDMLAQKNPYLYKIKVNLVPITDYVMYATQNRGFEAYAIKRGEEHYFQSNKGLRIDYLDNKNGINAIICAHFIASENMPQLDRQIGVDPQPTLQYRLRSQLRLDSEGKYYIENDKFNHILYNTLNRNVEVLETGLSSHFNPKDGMHTVVGTKDSLNKKPVLMKLYSETRDKFGDLTSHLSKYTPTTSVQEPTQPLEAFIYPNPVTDMLNIERNREGQATLIITNQLGQTVYRSLMEAGEQSAKLPFGEAPTGLYYIRIVYPNGEIERQRFIKQ